MISFNNKDTVAIHIAKRCNMRCGHCYQQKTNYDNVMDFDRVCKSIDFLNLKNIAFYGGEALLCPDKIKSIINKYPDKGYMIHTNGTIYNKEILDRMDIIFITVETFFQERQSKYRKLNGIQWKTLMRIIKEYKGKIKITHNVYPTENDNYFFRMARLAGIPYNVYPIVMDTEEFEYDEYISSQMEINRSPLFMPKLRILEDGTITRDMQGLYNEDLPMHDKCRKCNFSETCPALKMFPHFCYDILNRTKNKNLHFCKLAEAIWKSRFSSK